MPQVDIPPGFCKIDLFWTFPGGRGTGMTVFGSGYDILVPDAELGAAVEDVFTPVAQNAVAQVTLVKATIHKGAVTPPYVAFDQSIGVAGTGAGNITAANVSVLVKKRTATAGRPGRGRTYFPCFPADEQVRNDSTLEPVTQAGYQTMADNLLDAMNVEPLRGMVILHPTGSSDVTPSEVTTYTVDGLLATQRRRLR
jgi:hypothetical protein